MTGADQSQSTVKISEIFSSTQGEGPYAGQAQIFIRFHGCNMSCVFCDTPQKSAPEELNLRSILKKVSGLNKDKKINTVSITGGEPLLHAVFLKGFLPRLKGYGYKIYLDTNGTLPDKLKEVINLMDVVAMDIKLPSSTREREFWKQQREFLETARLREVFVKMVISSETTESDFNKAVEMIESIDKNTPLILQPVSKVESFDKTAENAILVKWQRAALKKLTDVRIIPQLHKIYGLK